MGLHPIEKILLQRPVGGVQVGGPLRVERAAGSHPFPMAGEYALDEISKSPIVPEPTLLGYRKTGPFLRKNPGEDADAVFGARMIRIENIDTFRPAAR